jgi:DNA-binding XRE family transcriptional regulator
MARSEYRSVSHDHDAFLERALKRKGFREAYDDLEDEYVLVRELLAARAKAGLTQEEVAASMGTTKSAVSRLEGAGKHSPSVSTLKKYAEAVGCEIEIRLVPSPCRTSASSRLGARKVDSGGGRTVAPRR